ncbi:transforming acidic coiled-coil-containing protein 1 [Eudromia elegans]
MASGAWHVLSPLQWARWTWAAVRGGGSPACSSDSEGNFGTPEAETPTPPELRAPQPVGREPGGAGARGAAEGGVEPDAEPAARAPGSAPEQPSPRSEPDGSALGKESAPEERAEASAPPARSDGTERVAATFPDAAARSREPPAEPDAPEEAEGGRRAAARRGSRIPTGTLTPKREAARRAAEDAAPGPRHSPERQPLGAPGAGERPEAAGKPPGTACPDARNDLKEIPEWRGLARSPGPPALRAGLFTLLFFSPPLCLPPGLFLGCGRTTEQVKFLCFLLSGCKVKRSEVHGLVLDVGGAQEDGALLPRLPELAGREGHATDEEKLASSSSVPRAPAERKGEPEDDLEYFECSAVPVPGAETGPAQEPCKQAEKDGALLVPGSAAPEGPPGHLGDADKAAVLALAREEIVAKELEASEWRRRYEGSRQEVLEMRKIVAEYERTIAQMIEDEQRATMTSQKNLQQLSAEKEQALADLSSVERSLSELFRRYENLKGVLEGFKKNEDALKKCAQDYLARVRQEEQRYQALKVHAEEKLDKANEEIAQVRAKAKAESAALHAGLRKEQMKVESLERALQQKNQEIEELTKICDELIAKLGRTE